MPSAETCFPAAATSVPLLTHCATPADLASVVPPTTSHLPRKGPFLVAVTFLPGLGDFLGNLNQLHPQPPTFFISALLHDGGKPWQPMLGGFYHQVGLEWLLAAKLDSPVLIWKSIMS